MTKEGGNEMLHFTADLWSQGESALLWDPEAIDSFRKWGYFSQKLRLRNS
jgi:hypothetical protein